jgi:uncharacterized membrane protein
MAEPRWKADSGLDSDSAQAGGDASANGTPHPIDDLFKHLAEVREYALLYLESRKDQIRVRIQKGILFAGLGLVALAVAATALIVSVVLLIGGIAGGVAWLLGARPWLGQLITGTVVLGGTALGMWLLARRLTAASRRHLTEKYERKRRELRERFGRQASPEATRGDSHV